MADITAAMVKELREATNVGMMECKKALVETNGDKDEAVKILRERGLAIAHKKASREANQGLISAEVLDGGKSGSMIEVNCETDFVARNENFQAFVADLLKKSHACEENQLAESVKEEMTAKIAEIGENMKVARNVRYVVEGTGAVFCYIHLGGKCGVLLELAFEKPATLESPAFGEMAKDITLHIAASNPQYLTSDEVPDDVIEAEKDIYRKQMEGKPENILENILKGKINKYFSQICLLDQGFVKDPDVSISQLMEKTGKEVGDTISIKRFTRYQIGG